MKKLIGEEKLNHEQGNVETEHLIEDRDIVSEVEVSFINYAMSVIASRALPDARDGLKPVQRRILYALHSLNIYPSSRYKKSARVVGEVVGKYHPHGDTSIYGAIVLMAQDFTNRYPFVDGQGNFGSIDRDAPAAMRYTEMRMSNAAAYMLKNIEKDTVDLVENYDGSEREPKILPGLLPGLLMNGSSGIAVGVATNIPPHNLNELIAAIIATIKNPKITLEKVLTHIKGPDFPTFGKIVNANKIPEIYETGRGSIIMEGVYHIEEKNRSRQIVITEIPFKVNKAELIKKIAELVNQEKINGVNEIKDESNRKGIRLVVGVKNKFEPNVIVAQIIKHTQFRTSFPVNMMALINQKPYLFNLQKFIHVYIDHQNTIIRRATNFDLQNAKQKFHILDGFRVVLNDLDKAIEIIKASKDRTDAIGKLMQHFVISNDQATAVINLTLGRLTNLEQNKIFDDLKATKELIEKLEGILNDQKEINKIIINNLTSINKKLLNPRRTVLENKMEQIDDLSLIPNLQHVVTFTENNYIKSVLFDKNYHVQKRGGVGSKTLKMYEDDFVLDTKVAHAHDVIYFVTNKGRFFSLRIHDIPLFSKSAKGLPLVNLLPKLAATKEKVVSIFIKKQSTELSNKLLIVVTKKGRIKKASAQILRSDLYNSRQKNGKRIIRLHDNDDVAVAIFAGMNQKLAIGTYYNKALVTDLTKIRLQKGNAAAGVKGPKLQNENDHVVSACAVSDNDVLLSITNKGYGKLLNMNRFMVTGRKSQGVNLLSIKHQNKGGHLVAFLRINKEKDHLFILKDDGVAIMIKAKDIKSLSGRSGIGVKIIKLPEKVLINSVAIINPIKNDKL